MKNKFLLCGVLASLLSTNVMANEPDIDIDLSRLGVQPSFCSSCKLRLPEDLKRKIYPYQVDNGFVYDENDNFVGLSKVEQALRDAGIMNFKLDIQPNSTDGNLLFNVKTDDRNKDFVSLVVTHIDGVDVTAVGDMEEEIKDKISKTDGFDNCHKRAYASALQKLISSYDKTKYNYEYGEDVETKFITDDTFEVISCVNPGYVEKKEAEEGVEE